ncbi:MAG: amidohydrolase [Rhizobacter sp.]|nr:amidohydrolase [Chlorobiales bacterium]
MLIENAVIVDSTFEPTPFNAVQIKNGVIQKLLTSAEAVRLPDERIDAKGRLLLPAFFDSHTHLLEFGLRFSRLNLKHTGRAAALDLVRAAVHHTPKGKWITGGGWMKKDFSTFPFAIWLDEISTEHFIALSSQDSHAVWCNTSALELLRPYNFSEQELPTDPAAGEKFSGMCFERAAQKMMSLIETGIEQKTAALRNAQRELFKLGITETISVESASALPAYKSLGDDLKLRTGIAILCEEIQAAKLFFRSYQHERLHLNSAKLFLDGSLGAETASVLAPFNRSPKGTVNYGLDLYAEPDILAMFKLIEREGLPVAVHAIGNKAVRRALNAFEKLFESSSLSFGKGDKGDFQHRIEHAQMISMDDAKRFSNLNLIASMQPVHIREDIATAAALLDDRQQADLYRFASLEKSGATYIFGSDAPIETPNVFEGLYFAAARKDAGGNDWFPKERISLKAALKAYTQTPHRATGNARTRGKVESGYAADLILLSENILKMPAESIRDAEVVLTMAAGEIVFSQK